MLWLCLHFDHLSVEVFTRATAVSGPLVVTEGNGARRWVLGVNPEAGAAGIRPGMSLGAAHALSPDLRVQARDSGAEARALTGLAAWAGKFTPWVSLSPSAVLLEVQGSLGLFGGVAPLVERVEQGVRSLGYSASTGVAPTPLAAEFLARSTRGAQQTDAGGLARTLSPLPLRVLGLPGERVEALEGMGLRSLGDCLRQPREGLNRRFGPGLLEALDRALGRLPDPRTPYVSPPHFECRLDLPAEVKSTESLLFGSHRMLQELEGFLRAKGAGIQRFELALTHHGVEPTRTVIGLATPGRDSRRLLSLLRERLGSMTLSAPVASLTLSAGELVPLSPRNGDLFATEDVSEQDASVLLERLRARLGEGAVQGIRLVPDHRPEKAVRWVSSNEEAASATRVKGKRRKAAAPGRSDPPSVVRPFWLLPEPIPVSAEGLAPIFGAERIESGWWDGEDVARDYFVAEDEEGSRFWVYQERRGSRQWFLHGIFG